MHKLSFGIAAQIVVTEEGIDSDCVSQNVGLLLKRLLVSVITDADISIEDEVHFEDLFFFVVDHVFVFLLAEMAWLQSEGYIVEELAILVLLRVKEEPEVIEDVVEQIVHNDASFDLARQSINELVVFLDLAQSVVGPEVLEVLIDLAVQRIW